MLCEDCEIFQIMRFIHCSDNNIDTCDKVCKLRNLMENVKTRFVEMFAPVQNVHYDESMIKYFGRHNCKQLYEISQFALDI